MEPNYKRSMIYQFESAKAFLQSHFDDRVRRNARYSLRSYANFLGVNPAELSQVFKGQRNLSFTSAQKVTKALGFNSDEAKYFLWTLQMDKGQAMGLDLDFVQDKEKSNVPEQNFSEICQWHHFAILSLIDTKNFEWSSPFVAKSLGLSLSEAGLAMRDLQKFGLIKVEKKSPKATKSVVQISSNIPSSAIRTYHRQMLQKSIDALDSVPMELREYQSVGLALDEADLKKLKKEIDEFTDRIISKYHKKTAKNVYQIQIAAFPLTKGVTK
jgi:uncharacterized protein (TIGR02147 family)